MPTALDTFCDALVAYGQQDFEAATHLAQMAAQTEPANAVYVEAVTYLRRVQREGKGNVYVSPHAFGAFIRGGGNIPLYENTSAALKRVYEQYDSLSLLDIGVGDGLALLPALTDNIRHLDVLEPSSAMLNQTSAALHARCVEHRAINTTVQQLMAVAPGKWSVIQSTYALQSIHPGERPALFAWLRRHAGRVLIAEFDAPDFKLSESSRTGIADTGIVDIEQPSGNLASPDRVRYFVERYQRGLAEYQKDGMLVAQGFLMPVFFGGFDPTEARVNWETPIAEWTRLLRAAGFANTQAEPIYDYWWATAYLMDAT